MSVLGESLDEAPGLSPHDAKTGNTAKEITGRGAQRLGDRKDDRETRVALVGLDLADVVRGQTGSFRELLQRHAGRLAASPNLPPERHDGERRSERPGLERTIVMLSITIVWISVRGPGGWA